jgi:hypothetical protein
MCCLHRRLARLHRHLASHFKGSVRDSLSVKDINEEDARNQFGTGWNRERKVKIKMNLDRSAKPQSAALLMVFLIFMMSLATAQAGKQVDSGGMTAALSERTWRHSRAASWGKASTQALQALASSQADIPIPSSLSTASAQANPRLISKPSESLC